MYIYIYTHVYMYILFVSCMYIIYMYGGRLADDLARVRAGSSLAGERGGRPGEPKEVPPGEPGYGGRRGPDNNHHHYHHHHIHHYHHCSLMALGQRPRGPREDGLSICRRAAVRLRPGSLGRPWSFGCRRGRRLSQCLSCQPELLPQGSEPGHALPPAG